MRLWIRIISVLSTGTTNWPENFPQFVPLMLVIASLAGQTWELPGRQNDPHKSVFSSQVRILPVLSVHGRAGADCITLSEIFREFVSINKVIRKQVHDSNSAHSLLNQST